MNFWIFHDFPANHVTDHHVGCIPDKYASILAQFMSISLLAYPSWKKTQVERPNNGEKRLITWLQHVQTHPKNDCNMMQIL